MYDASNRKDIRKAEKAALRAEHERIEWLRSALSVVGGRSWFHNVLCECHLFSDPFTGDALKEAYLKGERNIGLRLFSDIIAHCPDQYLLMMREANARTPSQQPREPDADGGDSGSDSDLDDGDET